MKRRGHVLKSKPMENGEPDLVTPDGFYYMECCDCSLVHLIKITQLAKRRGFVVAAWRDDYQTRAKRAAKRKRKK